MTEKEYILAVSRERYLAAEKLLHDVLIVSEDDGWYDEHHEICRRLRALQEKLNARFEVTPDEI